MSDVVTDFAEEQLRELAERGAAEMEGASATDILRWTDEHFGGVDGPRGWANCKYVVACNMQDAVMVSLAAEYGPACRCSSWTPVTTSPKPSAPATRSTPSMTSTFSTSPPSTAWHEQDELMGKDLFARDPNECCRLRKVVPLAQSAERIRRHGSPGCAGWSHPPAPTRR